MHVTSGNYHGRLGRWYFASATSKGGDAWVWGIRLLNAEKFAFIAAKSTLPFTSSNPSLQGLYINTIESFALTLK